MNLQNGYKVLYATAADGKRTFLASKTGLLKDADTILEAAIGEYKLVYEKDGKIYGSAENVPTENDKCFDEFDTVFKANSDESTEQENPVEPEQPKEDEPADNTQEEGQDENEDEVPSEEE